MYGDFEKKSKVESIFMILTVSQPPPTLTMIWLRKIFVKKKYYSQ